MRWSRLFSMRASEPLSLDQVAGRLAAGADHQRPFVSFTFDDGYRDNRDFALPVLKRHGVPMTVYVASDFADGRGKLWWLTLEAVIAKASELAVTIADERVAVSCGSAEEKQKAFDTLYWRLRPLPDSAIHEIVDRLAAEADIDPFSACRNLVMGWDELREFATEPLVTIGAHTCSHISLAKYPEADARAQMQDSVIRIKQEIGVQCRHFSYPYGDAGSAGEREFAIANDMGMATAVTTAKGVVPSSGNVDRCAIPRFSLNGEFQDLRHIKVLLSGLPFAMLNLANKVSPARLPIMKSMIMGGGPGQRGLGSGHARSTGAHVSAPRVVVTL